jgi:hypothetical protein
VPVTPTSLLPRSYSIIVMGFLAVVGAASQPAQHLRVRPVLGTRACVPILVSVPDSQVTIQCV